MQNSTKQAGFTLTELIIVIVIIGIISAVITPLIGNKFSAVAQSTKRASWVEQAEYAIHQIRQDLALSVPNSIFTSTPLAGDDQVVEFLAAPVGAGLYAGRYRNNQYNPYDRLQPNNDDQFDIFGGYANVPGYVSVATPSASQARLDWEALRAGSSIGHLAEVQSTSILPAENGNERTLIVLSGAHNFGDHSPYFRAYFFDGPIGYECDTSAGYLYRVSGYLSLSTLTFANRTTLAVRDRVISNVQRCKFEYLNGSVYASPGLRITLAIGDGTESIQLVETIFLSNAS